MSKSDDVNDILGEGKPPVKTDKAKPAKKGAAPAKEAKPAKKAKAEEKPAKAKKEAVPAKKAEPKAKEPVVFEEGERDKLLAKIEKTAAKLDKKVGINSKELAAKFDVETRKLRPVLYSAERAGIIKLKLGASRTEGMTVLPA